MAPAGTYFGPSARQYQRKRAQPRRDWSCKEPLLHSRGQAIDMIGIDQPGHRISRCCEVFYFGFIMCKSCPLPPGLSSHPCTLKLHTADKRTEMAEGPAVLPSFLPTMTETATFYIERETSTGRDSPALALNTEEGAGPIGTGINFLKCMRTATQIAARA